MYIERLVLRHFRNYKETTLAFAPGGAYISGANGSGKTNILESIYYLANHASFRTTRREELQTWNVSQSAVYARVVQRETGRQSELAIHLTPSGRRLFVNGKETRDLRRFTSEIAAVAFHPGTMNVIKGGPAGRRYLVDRGIFSLQPEFGQTSQQFQRALKQRNALLRRKTSGDASSLATWTEHFVELSVQLMLDRQAHVERLNRALEKLVEALGNDVGLVSLQYKPAIFAKCDSSDDMLAAWQDEKRLRERCFAESQRLQHAEEAMGQALFGPQRDDFTIRFRGRESRGYASQGEQRLAAFLLIAALAIEIRQQRGHHPVILLDDVISELDARNRQVIFDFLKAYAFQVLITDVEARPQSHDLGLLKSLRVRQVGGWADVSEGAEAQGSVALDNTPHDL